MTTILIKKKDTAGAPAAGDLTNAAGGTEIAVNTATKRIYTKDSGGNVVELGTNPSVITNNLLFSPDNTYDIGASGTSRPRSLFLGTNITVGSLTSTRVPYASTGGLLVDSANLLFDGTTLTANALTTTSTVTINGGTANGVAYLNGSKVLTTGSALTFDGTNLGIGVSPSFRLDVAGAARAAGDVWISGGTGTARRLNFDASGTYYNWIESDGTVGAGYTRFAVNNSEQMRLTSTGLGIGTSSPDAKLDVTSAGSAAAYTVSAVIQDATYPASGNPTLEFNGFIGGNSYRAGIGSIGGQQLAFYTPSTFGVAPTRQMTLNESGNLGIGTSSPGYRLDTESASNGFVARFKGGSTGQAGLIYSDPTEIDFSDAAGLNNFGLLPGSNVARVVTNGAERLRVDSSGNLGLGVTPSAWGSTNGGALQMGAGYTSLYSYSNAATLGSNVYYNAGNKYFASGVGSSAYQQLGGVHYWLQAPSGTAGNAITFTQAMTLDASGNLLVGNTSGNVGSYGKAISLAATASAYAGLEISGTTGGALEFQTSQSTRQVQLLGNSSGFIVNVNGGSGLAERARITSGGYFKASNAGTYLGSAGDYHELRSSNDNYLLYAVNTRNGGNGPFGISVEYSAQDPNGTGNEFLQCVGISTLRAEIRSNGGLANYQSNNVDLSDARTKTDINPLGSYWSKIAGLEIVTYKYKDQTHDDLNIGVIAQQVEAVAPEFVNSDGFGDTPEDGVPLKMIYNKDLTFAAIKALQEAMARIETLEAELAALKGA
jgi:hypothetical protein